MKNYIVIGATSGIGEACAKKLSGKDNTLVIVGRNEEKLDWLKNTLSGNIIPVQYDLSDLYNIKEIYNVCKTQSIKLDGMVYSAGVDGTWPIKVNSINKMRKMMDINCFAFVELARMFYSGRISNEGASIVAISSIASLTMEPGMVSYSASKAALNAVVKTMAKEFIRRKIRVNAVLPAGVSTPMAEMKGELLSEVQKVQEGQEKSDVHGLGMIPPEQVAEQVEFLLSDKSAFKTGEFEVLSAGTWY